MPSRPTLGLQLDLLLLWSLVTLFVLCGRDDVDCSERHLSFNVGTTALLTTMTSFADSASQLLHHHATAEVVVAPESYAACISAPTQTLCFANIVVNLTGYLKIAQINLIAEYVVHNKP